LPSIQKKKLRYSQIRLTISRRDGSCPSQAAVLARPAMAGRRVLVSLASARALHGRLEKRVGKVTPEAVEALGESGLRALGRR